MGPKLQVPTCQCIWHGFDIAADTRKFEGWLMGYCACCRQDHLCSVALTWRASHRISKQVRLMFFPTQLRLPLSQLSPPHRPQPLLPPILLATSLSGLHSCFHESLHLKPTSGCHVLCSLVVLKGSLKGTSPDHLT